LNVELTYIPYLDEKAIAIDNVEKGHIPLVVSGYGNPLRTVADCKEWRDEYLKAHRAKRIRKMAGGLVQTPINSDSESPFDLRASPDSPEPRGKAKHQITKKGKPSHYVDVAVSSKSESHSDSPEPSSSLRIAKHQYHSKKWSRSEHMSDSESEDPDAARWARKQTKDKKGGSHHRIHRNPEHHRKKSKKAKRHHYGQAKLFPFHLNILTIDSDQEVDKNGRQIFLFNIVNVHTPLTDAQRKGKGKQKMRVKAHDDSEDSKSDEESS
jgi:hypothetical protein